MSDWNNGGMLMRTEMGAKSVLMCAMVAVLLLFFALPSVSFGQEIRWPILKEKQRQEIRKKLEKHQATPEEIDLLAADQWEREAERQYLEKNQPKEGFLTSIYKILTNPKPFGVATADVIAGSRDQRDPDMPTGAAYYPLGIHNSPPPPPAEKSVSEILEEHQAGKPSPAATIRAKRAARRAMKTLAAAKKLAQTEKMKAEAQAGRAIEAQESSGCFPRDIRVVMADGTHKSIAEVKAGDLVMTYDIGYNRNAGKAVLRAYSVKSNHLYTVNGDFKTTGGERLLTQSGWKPLRFLERQDRVHANGRMTEVETIDCQRMELTTYNLEVDDTHNFYVQTQSGNTYLVHNGGGGK
jgi:hypothetical protein